VAQTPYSKGSHFAATSSANIGFKNLEPNWQLDQLNVPENSMCTAGIYFSGTFLMKKGSTVCYGTSDML
jgi:hypothetical protein